MKMPDVSPHELFEYIKEGDIIRFGILLAVTFLTVIVLTTLMLVVLYNFGLKSIEKVEKMVLQKGKPRP